MGKFDLSTAASITPNDAFDSMIGEDNKINETYKIESNNIVKIANELIDEREDQPFIIDQKTVDDLADDIKVNGQLSPLIIRHKEDGRYELIDGRHRRRAILKNNAPESLCVIEDVDDKQATLIMVNSNINRRNDFLPSELAFAYKLQDECLGDEEVNDASRKKKYRYIQLTKLHSGILSMIDERKIPMVAGVELSYLAEDDQKALFHFLELNTKKINLKKAVEIRELAGKEKLTSINLKNLLLPNKPEKPPFSIKLEQSYFPEFLEKKEIKGYVEKALSFYKEHKEINI